MDQQQTEERGGLATRWVELVVALVIVAGGGVVIFDSMRIGAGWASDGPQAGYFPNLVGWSLALAGLWLIGKAAWTWKKLEGKVFVHWNELRTVLAMLVPTAVFVLLIAWLGIYVASAIYIAGFMMWQGKYRLLPSLAVGVAVPVAMFLLFEIWFLVPLPKGPLEHLLGY